VADSRPIPIDERQTVSKEPDKDPVEPTDGKRSRRRRPRSGLRVPSDDVPRQHLHAAVMAVPPLPPEADLGDEDPADSYPAGPGSEEEPGDERADGQGGEPNDDLHDDVADDDVADDDVADDLHDDLGPSPAGATGLAASPGQALRPAAIDAVPVYQEDRPPVHARAITSELLTVSAEQAGETSVAAGDLAPPEGARFDSHIPKTVKMTALPFDDVGSMSASEEEEEEEDDDDDSVDIPIEEDEPAPSEPAQRRPPRASTMALSDDDLEEFLEPAEDGEDDAEDALAALAAMMGTAGMTGTMGTTRSSFSARLPALKIDQLASDDEGPEDQAAEVQALARGPAAQEEASVEDSASDAEEAPEQGEDADAVAVTEDGPERADSEAPDALADTSDSGEILEDDMIEELDEPKAAARQEALAPPAPPPAPPKSAPVKVAPKTPPPAPKSADSTPSTNTSKGRTRKGKSWFEEIFDEDYLRTLPFLTPQATQAEALFVAEALGVEPGARLLDVGCGYGRHAMELAARGYQIVALDLSLPLLLRGADEAQRRGLNINFIHGDMRDLVFESQFDGIYCLFSTFGYFDEETNRKVIEGMARAVKRGGRVVLDVLNRDYLIGELPTRVWWEGDGCVVLEEVDFNYFTSRIHSNRSIVFDDGRQLEQEISIRSYSLHELGKMLHTAGLRVIEVSGSTAMRGRFFGNQSRGLIVVAEKRERAKTATAPGSEPSEPAGEDDLPEVDVPDV
jgi:SAM-dependent methyltransferase